MGDIGGKQQSEADLNAKVFHGLAIPLNARGSAPGQPRLEGFYRIFFGKVVAHPVTFEPVSTAKIPC